MSHIACAAHEVSPLRTTQNASPQNALRKHSYLHCHEVPGQLRYELHQTQGLRTASDSDGGKLSLIYDEPAARKKVPRERRSAHPEPTPMLLFSESVALFEWLKAQEMRTQWIRCPPDNEFSHPIYPRIGSSHVMFRALWNYRVFVFSSIRNEFESRFSRSKLGGLWMIINPLVQVIIFAMVLSNLLAARLPGINNEHAYALYLMAGTLAWGLFSEIVSRSLNLFIEQAGVMKKIQFPRITLPTILIGSALLNNILLFVSILVIFALLGHMPNASVLWIPLLTLIVMVMASGIGLILGIFNVFLRDLAQIVPVVLQIIYWLTPIVYPVSVIPKEYQIYLEYNPMYPLVAAYHNVLVYGASPDWIPLLKLLALSVTLLLLGLFLFRKASPEIVDVL